MVRKILIVIVIFLALAFGVYKYGYYRAQALPENNPREFVKNGGKHQGQKVLVCIGDSITHGRVSYDYVKLIRDNLAPKGIEVVNAGINSETAWNVLNRINDIIACNPDYITILIGTNDANGAFSPVVAEKQAKEVGLPQAPDEAWFRENLTKLCEILKSQTKARIALLSIPPIGEEPEHPAFKQAQKFSAIIRDVAQKEGVTYIPLNEKLTDMLIASGRRPRFSYSPDDFLMYSAIARHILLGQDFDKISEINGQYLLTDHLHLNGRAAGITAGLIENFVLG
ncbi:MAG TPA: GDSL-type esterase/lipase family protein [Desulfomonilia bacterium]